MSFHDEYHEAELENSHLSAQVEYLDNEVVTLRKQMALVAHDRDLALHERDDLSMLLERAHGQLGRAVAVAVVPDSVFYQLAEPKNLEELLERLEKSDGPLGPEVVNPERLNNGTMAYRTPDGE